MPEPSPLTPFLRRAGAVIGTRRGRPVAIHYGSAVGELAACLRYVGLVDRSDLALIGITAPPPRLDDLQERRLGLPLAVGGVAPAGDAWWCRAAPRELLVVCAPDGAARLTRRLRADGHRSTGLTVEDRSDRLTAIGVIGPATPGLLAELGAYGAHGDPRRATPFGTGELAGIEIRWLLQADDRALALVGRRSARSAWESIERAGRDFGVSYVGADADARFSLATRLRARHLRAVA